MDNEKFICDVLRSFMYSKKRADMLCAQRYYCGEHDILRRVRTIIGEGGDVCEVNNLPNNKIVDNQYARTVDQKVNYLLGKPVLFKATSNRAEKYLKSVITPKFQKMLQRVLKNMYNGGIGYIYVYYDKSGKLNFRDFKSHEIVPIWGDTAHENFLGALHVYGIYDERKKKHDMVDIYTKNGIKYAEIKGGNIYYGKRAKSGLQFDYSIGEYMPYISVDGKGYNWKKLPMIAVKLNDEEMPLIKRVKTLQDSLNTMRSDFMNIMQEDCRNTVLVIKNYDGTDLGEFRKNLALFGAVKVRSCDGLAGGIDTLNIEVNSENYRAICDMLKKAIIENGRGFDARDERFSSNPNQMSILTMYCDIDLDADEQESRLKEMIKQILWFLKCDSGFEEIEDTQIVFNRSMPVNESEIIANCNASANILSKEDIAAHHPWRNEI